MDIRYKGSSATTVFSSKIYISIRGNSGGSTAINFILPLKCPLAKVTVLTAGLKHLTLGLVLKYMYPALSSLRCGFLDTIDFSLVVD